MLLFASPCKSGYKRQKGCHLDKMAINGNVVKVETIVQSTIPLTEVFYDAIDPFFFIVASSPYSGNFTTEFDNEGNVKRFIGYGIDGETLFDNVVEIREEAKITPWISSFNQRISDVKTVCTNDGRVLNAKYFDGKNLIWEQNVKYNKDRTLKSIIKNYKELTNFADTTIYKHVSYDSMGNWVEAEVEYKGVLPRHHDEYRIKRQITYFGDKENTPLINDLQKFNAIKRQTTSKFNTIDFGEYGSISLPHYMKLSSKGKIDGIQKNSLYSSIGEYLILSEYDSGVAYATFSITKELNKDTIDLDILSQEELVYDEDVNNELKTQYTNILAQSEIYILKWLPYEFVTISSKRATKIRYYRHGKMSPIPVYCEQYNFTMGDSIISIMYSFQSNFDYKFREDFNRAVKSVNFKKNDSQYIDFLLLIFIFCVTPVCVILIITNNTKKKSPTKPQVSNATKTPAIEK